MKRSEALKVLSHQHHQGLFAALQLRRASAETAGDARRAFLDFHDTTANITSGPRRRCLHESCWRISQHLLTYNKIAYIPV
jgi:hypothetical protein